MTPRAVPGRHSSLIHALQGKDMTWLTEVGDLIHYFFASPSNRTAIDLITPGFAYRTALRPANLRGDTCPEDNRETHLSAVL